MTRFKHTSEAHNNLAKYCFWYLGVCAQISQVLLIYGVQYVLYCISLNTTY